ncbi:nucleotide disphospho-sugar-binding domain-containing protein [Nocardia sp. NPDC050175]|uniref:nucleotide disphospho-sugar-binding domain-containing protein n=1 Tax=Nocardia sp. NPDC050175 TaxID=3364317 RepID=UPI0037A813A1
MTEMVPISWALRSAGWDVLVAGDPDVGPTARGAGLNIAEIGELVALEEKSKQGLPAEMFPLEVLASRTTEEGRTWWGQGSAALVPHAIEHIEEFRKLTLDWQPDVLVCDGMSILGWLLGSAVDVPFVRYLTGLAPFLGPFYDSAAQLLEGTCAKLGLPGLATPDLVIDPVPASLQAEDAPTGMRVRYVPYNNTGTLPRWAREKSDKRRVCVIFGSSTAMTGPRPVLNVLDALAGVPDVEITVALSAENHELVGPLPAEIRTVERLPLNLFMDSTDLVIHHGGAGTGLTATAYGVPQIVLPQWGNSFDYARRLTDAGAGLRFQSRAEQDDIGALRAAIIRILDDPGFTESAARLRTEMESAPPMPSAVDRIAKLAQGESLDEFATS